VQELRTARKFSQKVLGDAIGVSFQQVQKYERGANRISASALFGIAQTLGVSIALLFEGIGSEDSEAAGPSDARSVKLAGDFSRIPSPEVRAQVLGLVEKLAVD